MTWDWRSSEKRRRLLQIHRWLLKNFPVDADPVTLHLHKLPLDDGQFLTFGKAKMWDHLEHPHAKVTLERRRDLGCLIDTLLHEHGHLDVWHLRGRKDHPDEWGLAYAKRYRAFYDEGGRKDSLKF